MSNRNVNTSWLVQCILDNSSSASIWHASNSKNVSSGSKIYVLTFSSWRFYEFENGRSVPRCSRLVMSKSKQSISEAFTFEKKEGHDAVVFYFAAKGLQDFSSGLCRAFWVCKGFIPLWSLWMVTCEFPSQSACKILRPVECDWKPIKVKAFLFEKNWRKRMLSHRSTSTILEGVKYQKKWSTSKIKETRLVFLFTCSTSRVTNS